METFYATFGFNQTLGSCYVKFMAEDLKQANEIMYEKYGQLWAFIYSEKDFKQAIEQYGLREVPLGTENAKRTYEENHDNAD